MKFAVVLLACLCMVKGFTVPGVTPTGGMPPSCTLKKPDIEPMLKIILPALGSFDEDSNLEERLEAVIDNALYGMPERFPEMSYMFPTADELINGVTVALLTNTVQTAIQWAAGSITSNTSASEIPEIVTDNIMWAMLKLRMRCRTMTMQALLMEAITNWTENVTVNYQRDVNATADEKEILDEAREEIINRIIWAFVSPELQSLRAEREALGRIIGGIALPANISNVNVTKAVEILLPLSQCPTKSIYIEWALFAIKKIRMNLVDLCPRPVVIQLALRVLPPCDALQLMAGSKADETKDMVELLFGFVEEFQEWAIDFIELFEDAILRDEMDDLKEAIKPNTDPALYALLDKLVATWDEPCGV